MTTTPAAPAPRAGGALTLHLTDLLRRPLTDRQGETIGRLSDVIVRLARSRDSARDRPGRDGRRP